MILFEDKTILGDPLILLAVSTPSELGKDLKEYRAKRRGGSCFINVRLNDEQIFVRRFEFEDVKPKDLKDALLAQAVDLLFFPTDEIEIDYQIFRCDPVKIEGVYVCMPKGLIRSYLFELDKARVIPIGVTVPILRNIDVFFAARRHVTGLYALIDCSLKNVVNLSVFHNKLCQFLRKINYDSPEGVRHEVVQSLRSACSVSSVKEFNAVYVIGKSEASSGITQSVKDVFTTKVEVIELSGGGDSGRESSYFKINLFQKYIFTFKRRNWIYLTMYSIIFLLLMKIVFMGIEIRANHILLQGYRFYDYFVHDYYSKRGHQPPP